MRTSDLPPHRPSPPIIELPSVLSLDFDRYSSNLPEKSVGALRFLELPALESWYDGRRNRIIYQPWLSLPRFADS